jgi:hypothetical protein
MGNLASVYQKQGRWQDAKKLQVQVMQTFKKIQSQEHPDTITSMENLALTYLSLGQLVEAEQLLIQVVDGTRKTLGVNHPSTVEAIRGLASVRQVNQSLRALSGKDELVSRLRNILPQLVTPRSLGDRNTDKEKLRLSLAASVEAEDDKETFEARLEQGMAMLLHGNDNSNNESTCISKRQ